MSNCSAGVEVFNLFLNADDSFPFELKPNGKFGLTFNVTEGYKLKGIQCPFR